MRATASQVAHQPADRLRRRPLQPQQPASAEDQEQQDQAARTNLATPGQPKDVPAPGLPDSPVDALNGIHQHTWHAAMGLRYLALRHAAREENPLYKSYQIVGASGVYFAIDEPQGEPARSITVYNPSGNVPAYVGIGGVDATSAAGALEVIKFVTIPLQVDVVKVGFNPTDLAANNATLFVFRWSTVQPFAAQ